MSRKPRTPIIAPNQIYHIVSRGNNEKRIFRSSRDYRKFLSVLKETKKKFPFYLYCYTLMPNHYHLEIETQEISISKIMHRINFLYAIYFKKRYKKSGHLFQDRFYSSLVEKESYFWAVARYIDLNPVKAGLVELPEEWPWGSFRFYFQGDDSAHFVDIERFLEFYDKDLISARELYISYVREGIQREKTPDFITPKLV